MIYQTDFSLWERNATICSQLMYCKIPLEFDYLRVKDIPNNTRNAEMFCPIWHVQILLKILFPKATSSKIGIFCNGIEHKKMKKKILLHWAKFYMFQWLTCDIFTCFKKSLSFYIINYSCIKLYCFIISYHRSSLWHKDNEKWYIENIFQNLHNLM